MNPSASINRSAKLSPANKGKRDEQSWLRHFWLLLAAFAVIGATAIYFYLDEQASEIEEEAYVSVSVRTSVGIDQLVICKLSLLIDPEQEKGLTKRQKMLEAVVSNSLATSYQQESLPKMAEVRDSLLIAINRKLPRKLKVQDVLIQELLVGIG
jgi:hypothetical protein